jgi:hypothetical protein
MDPAQEAAQLHGLHEFIVPSVRQAPGFVGLAIFLWWLRILLTLLRDGPTASAAGWLASIIVVTVLGPLGALIHLATRPDRHLASSQTRVTPTP